MTTQGLSGSPAFGIGVLLPAVLLTPPLLFYLNAASSMALGATIAGLFAVAFFLLQKRACASSRFGGTFSFGTTTVMLLSLVVAHAAITSTVLPFDAVRASASLIPLVVVLCAGYALGRLFMASRDTQVDRAIGASIGLLTLAGIFALVGFAPLATGNYHKPVFPFTEPSHFAQAFMPLLMYLSVRARSGWSKVFVLLFGLVVAGVLESLTLVVGWCLVTAVCLRAFMLPLLLAPVVLVAAQLDLTYYAERVNLSGDIENLSSLVYLQGWQLIAESWIRSRGWGLGFQQLGVQGTEVTAASLIFALLGDNANLLDGSFALAKVTSEFGLFGVILVLAYLGVAWRAIVQLSRTSQGTKAAPAPITLARCVIAGFLIEVFIRGTGYFSGTAILLVAALVVMRTSTSSRSLRTGVATYRKAIITVQGAGIA